jgi:hypothetical protein
MVHVESAQYIGKKSIEYDVSEMIGQQYNPAANTGALTALQILRKMYYGFAGGVKFKFRVMGAYNVQVTYVPPKPHRNGAANLIQASRVFSTDPALGALVDPIFSWPVDGSSTLINPFPAQEAANYNTAIATNYPDPAHRRSAIANSVQVLDVEIPYMNMCDFAGNISGDGPGANDDYYVDSLGSIVLSFMEREEYDNQVIAVDVWAAFDDTARLGMQVRCPVIYPYYETISSQHLQINAFGGVTTLSPLNPQTYPAAYYARTS